MISSSLFYFNSKNTWSNAAIYAIMGMLVVSSIFVCIIAFIDCVKGIRNYAKNYKSKKIVPENFNSDQRKTPNSVVSHINLNNNSRLYQSQTMTEAQEPRYVSSVIESNHKLEEVKHQIQQRERIRQKANYNDLSMIQREIQAIIK